MDTADKVSLAINTLICVLFISIMTHILRTESLAFRIGVAWMIIAIQFSWREGMSNWRAYLHTISWVAGMLFVIASFWV